MKTLLLGNFPAPELLSDLVREKQASPLGRSSESRSLPAIIANLQGPRVSACHGLQALGSETQGAVTYRGRTVTGKKRPTIRNNCGALVEGWDEPTHMRTPIIALLTNDPSLEEDVARTLLKTGGLSHFAQSPGDMLDLIGTTGLDLALAVIDCEHGAHGLTLVGAIRSRREALPVIVLTGAGDELIEALAYANGATICLSKPVSAMQLAEAMKQCRGVHPQPATVA